MVIQIWMLTKCRAEQQTKIKTCLFYPYPRSYVSEWGHVPINIRQQDHSEKGSMCCVVQSIRRRNQALVKNADLRHPFCTVVMQWRKSASPVLIVLTCLNCHTFILVWKKITDSVDRVTHLAQSKHSKHILSLLLLCECRWIASCNKTIKSSLLYSNCLNARGCHRSCKI